VPWCDDCARFWSPPSLKDGTCPTCGAALETPPAPGRDGQDEEHPHAPWHFKLLLVALVVYLSYRLYQGIFWVSQHV
jgi:hypothetical protein